MTVTPDSVAVARGEVDDVVIDLRDSAPSPRTPRDALEELRARAIEALSPGSASGVERQRGKGKLLARERIDRLVDEGTFCEIGRFVRRRPDELSASEQRPLTDGVVTGWGRVDDRHVVVYAQDFTVLGGTLGEAHSGKLQRVLDMADRVGVPVIGINDGGGARVQEGVVALAAYGGVFERNVRLSGVVPQISLILGPCAGGAVYSPALTDFVILVRGISQMFITGPDVVRQATGLDVDADSLGGADVHERHSGVAAFVCDDEDAALRLTRRLLGFLPPNDLELPPRVPTADPPWRSCPELTSIVPSSPRAAYDVRDVLRAIVDDGDVLELFAHWAPNIVTAFARIGGSTVGLVANQPQVQAGAIDVHASEKGARFVRTCDAFNIPVIAVVDTPGFQPGVDQEQRGIIRHGAKLLYAFTEASVPTIQLVLRKAYGGAYIVMGSRSIGTDLAFAWPGAEIAVMSSQGAVAVAHRAELDAHHDPAARRLELEATYDELLANPWLAAERGCLDDVIEPADTRRAIASALEVLHTKGTFEPRRRHGNIPT